jgi:hypothetical protein
MRFGVEIEFRHDDISIFIDLRIIRFGVLFCCCPIVGSLPGLGTREGKEEEERAWSSLVCEYPVCLHSVFIFSVVFSSSITGRHLSFHD